MRYTVACDTCCEQYEIEKPMKADLPRCAVCGGALRRVYDQAPTVQYNAAGFHDTDYSRFERQVGKRRAAQFRASRDDAERRAKRGQLTPYERALEKV